MKRILLTCTDLMAIQFFTEHIKYWTENHYLVDLICSPVGGRMEELKQFFINEPSVTIREVALCRSPFSLSNIKGYRQMKRYLREDYDAVVTNEPVMGLVTRLAARKKRNCRVIYIAHGFHFYKGGSRSKNFIFKSIERFAAHFTDMLLTINSEDHAAAEAFHLRGSGAIGYIPGIGVNIAKFGPASTQERALIREELGLKPDDIAIVATAELNPNKNQQLLLHGLVEVLREVPSAKLLLIGKGDLLDDYRQLAKGLGIDGAVSFLGYRKDVARILKACDIGTSASYREGLPLNLIEEMATGLPIVASRNRGHKDIIKSAANGFLFDAKNASEFAKAILMLCRSSELRTQMGEYNREDCKRFDIARVKPMLLSAIENRQEDSCSVII